MPINTLIIFLLALIIEFLLGEPRTAVHPVVWIGKVVSFLLKGGNGRSPGLQFLYGAGVVLATIGIFVVPAYFILFYLRSLNLIAYFIISAVILKTTFSIKELRQSALRVRNLLVMDKLAEARLEVRALVGRSTSKLDKSQIVSAVVESVAENSCDSFVAPLFYFLLFGVQGAIAYRVINTLDAMIGHHGEFEYLGKFAARLDDVANLIPARITAVLIVVTAWICRKDASGAWRIMLRDRGRTESPNSGWTMSAIAGALGVQLEKVGYYKLGDNHNPLLTDTIDAALKMILTAALIWSLTLMLAAVIYHVTT